MAAQERRYDCSLDTIRRDHAARYQWAARRLSCGSTAIDAACGCGYGSAILANSGCYVVGYDVSKKALRYARKHWSAPAIEWRVADLNASPLPEADAVVSFETIEHLADPEPFLQRASLAAKRLLASVPNEAVMPYSPKANPFHHRHYTRDEFAGLLNRCGWEPVAWFGQQGKHSDVEPGLTGRTLIVDAVRAQ